jgi:hypothetical protein
MRCVIRDLWNLEEKKCAERRDLIPSSMSLGAVTQDSIQSFLSEINSNTANSASHRKHGIHSRFPA